MCADYLTKFIHVAEVYQATELSKTKRGRANAIRILDEPNDGREDYKPAEGPQSDQTWKIVQDFLSRANTARRKHATGSGEKFSGVIHPRLVVSDAGLKCQSTFETDIKEPRDKYSKVVKKGKQYTLCTIRAKLPSESHITTVKLNEVFVQFDGILRQYIERIPHKLRSQRM